MQREDSAILPSPKFIKVKLEHVTVDADSPNQIQVKEELVAADTLLGPYLRFLKVSGRITSSTKLDANSKRGFWISAKLCLSDGNELEINIPNEYISGYIGLDIYGLKKLKSTEQGNKDALDVKLTLNCRLCKGLKLL